MSKSKKPRVTVGMPVFNGEKYLAQALDSILAQTYEGFEIIILDNCSLDNTPSICRAYAAKDERIHYYRNKRNIGIIPNFNRVFKLSSTEYFKWAAHDDVIAPDFLSRSIKILDEDHSIVLCHSKTGRIDEEGDTIGYYDTNLKIDSSKTHERFGDLIRMNNYAWVMMYGLFRSSVLSKTQLLGLYLGSDRNFLAEMSLMGRFY